MSEHENEEQELIGNDQSNEAPVPTPPVPRPPVPRPSVGLPKGFTPLGPRPETLDDDESSAEKPEEDPLPMSGFTKDDEADDETGDLANAGEDGLEGDLQEEEEAVEGSSESVPETFEEDGPGELEDLSGEGGEEISVLEGESEPESTEEERADESEPGEEPEPVVRLEDAGIEAEEGEADLSGPDVESIFAKVTEEAKSGSDGEAGDSDESSEPDQGAEAEEEDAPQEITEAEESQDEEDSGKPDESAEAVASAEPDDIEEVDETETLQKKAVEVSFQVPKVKPVLLSAAAVYAGSKDESMDPAEEGADPVAIEGEEEPAGSVVAENEEEAAGEPEEPAEEGPTGSVVDDEDEVETEETPADDDDAETEETPADDDDAEESTEPTILEKLAEGNLEEISADSSGDVEAERDESEEDEDLSEDEDADDAEDEEADESPSSKVPDPEAVAELVARARKNKADQMEVMDPQAEKTKELFRPEESSSRWAFWRRPSKRDRQLARISEGYLEMVDLVRAIRNQMESQNENNLILRDSLAHLPEAMKGLDSFSKSQRTVGKALKEIHGQIRKSGAKDQKLVESMGGFNETLKGMDDTSRATMKTFDRVQERMRDSDIRMENLFQNVQSTEEKVGETMVRLQRNMAIMQSLFLICLMVVIGVLVFTVMGNWDQEGRKGPADEPKVEKVTPTEE